MTAEFARKLATGRDGFPDLLTAIEAHLEENDVPPGPAAQLMVALDELVSNVIDHGRAGESPIVEVHVVVAQAGVTGEVADDGDPFDPLAAPSPDTSLSVEDRPIGGLGIHLVRQLMDEVAYAREGGKNRLRFSKIYPLD